MTTDQKVAFIRNYISASLEAKHKQTKLYFLHMARGATMAYGADGSIGTYNLTQLTAEIETRLKEITQ